MAQTRSTDDIDVAEDWPDVSAHVASENRTVFTEDGNDDGWIATDMTVDLRR